MRTDSRLSRMLHVLLHMARTDVPFTSEHIGIMLGTNAAVVRRTMGTLRDAGHVAAAKGRGGGWTLACDLEATTLLDIDRALGGTGLFSMGFDNAHPACAVERVVNEAIGATLREAEALIRARFGAVTLAALARDFDAVCRAEGWDGKGAAARPVRRSRTSR